MTWRQVALSAARLLLTLAVLAFLLLSSWKAGRVTGRAEGAATCAAGQAEHYGVLLERSGQQLRQAQAASDALFQRIAQQAGRDEQTTKDLKHALAETADSRTACRFAAGVMQQLGAARDRAARAAAGGLGATLPGASGAQR